MSVAASSFAARVINQTALSGLVFVVTLAARLGLAIALGRSLTPAEFGVYSLIAGSVGVATLALQLGAQHYVVREVSGRPVGTAVAIFKSVFVVEYAVVLTAVAAGVFVLGLAWDWPPEVAAAGVQGLIVIAALIVAVSVAQDVARYLSARAEIERYNVVTFLEGGAWPLVVTALYLHGAHVSLTLVLASWIVGAALGGVYGLAGIGVRRLAAAPVEARLYPVAIRFGIPLLGTSLASLILAWSDRYFIAAFHSTAVLGVYSYHYNLVAMIVAVAGPLAGAALDPHIVAAYNRGDEARSERLLATVLRYRLMIVVPLVLVAVTWSDEIVTALARRAYASAGWLMAWLAPIPVLHALAVTFERVLYVERRTVAIGACYMTSAVATLVFNAALIPLHPFYGAALATDLGMALLAVLLWRQARGSRLRVRAPAMSIAVASVAAIGAAAGVRYLLPGDAGAGMLPLAAASVLLVFGAACLASGLIPPAERQAFAHFLGRVWHWRPAQ